MRPFGSSFLIAVSLAVLSSLAIAGSMQTDILGKWRAVNGVDEMTFLRDGTYTTSSGMVGKYTFPDDTHIKLTREDNPLQGARVLVITLSGDTLSLRGKQNGQDTIGKYQRIK